MCVEPSGIDDDAAIPLVIRAKGIAKSRRALGPQFVVVVVVVTRPAAALQYHHAQAGLRQFLGHHPAPGTRAHNDHIDFGK